MSNPEDIRQEISRTRAELSENVNALGDSASPGNIARGQVDKVKQGAAGLKEKVFGSPDDPYDDGLVGDARSGLGNSDGSASGMTSDAKDAVSDAPRQVESRTQGNPIAAGLIAVGVGALIGGLIPASQKESEAAQRLKEAAQPLVDDAKQVAAEARDNLQPVVEDAVGSVKDRARDAGGNVEQEAVQAKDEVTQKAKSSADTVRGDAQQAAEKSKQDAQQTAKGQQGDESLDGPSTFYG